MGVTPPAIWCAVIPTDQPSAWQVAPHCPSAHCSTVLITSLVASSNFAASLSALPPISSPPVYGETWLHPLGPAHQAYQTPVSRAQVSRLPGGPFQEHPIWRLSCDDMMMKWCGGGDAVTVAIRCCRPRPLTEQDRTSYAGSTDTCWPDGRAQTIRISSLPLGPPGGHPPPRHAQAKGYQVHGSTRAG